MQFSFCLAVNKHHPDEEGPQQLHSLIRAALYTNFHMNIVNHNYTKMSAHLVLSVEGGLQQSHSTLSFYGLVECIVYM